MITSMLIIGAMMFIPAYAIVLMIGGKAQADRFAKWVWAQLKKLISEIFRWVGQQVATLAARYPLAVGIIAVLMVLYFVFGGRHIW